MRLEKIIPYQNNEIRFLELFWNRNLNLPNFTMTAFLKNNSFFNPGLELSYNLKYNCIGHTNLIGISKSYYKNHFFIWEGGFKSLHSSSFAQTIRYSPFINIHYFWNEMKKKYFFTLNLEKSKTSYKFSQEYSINDNTTLNITVCFK